MSVTGYIYTPFEAMHMFTILITEMEQGQGSVISTERPLRVFFARKKEKSGHI